MLWQMIKESNKISLGHVNKVVMDLEKKGYIERLLHRRRLGDFPGPDVVRKGYEDEKATYRLVDPIGLLRYISLFRSMSELRTFSVRINAPPETVIGKLAKERIIFCLGTAQARYSPYFRPDEVSFYSEVPEQVLNVLSNVPHGDTMVRCYRTDYVRIVKDRRSLFNDFFATEEDSIPMTTKVQTVVDMFCDGKGVYSKPLIKQLWGVEI